MREVLSEFPLNIVAIGLPALFLGFILALVIADDAEQQAYDDCRRTHNVYVCTYQPAPARALQAEEGEAQ